MSMTVSEFCNTFNVSRTAALELIANGTVKAYQSGPVKLLRIKQSSIDEFKQQQKLSAAPLYQAKDTAPLNRFGGV